LAASNWILINMSVWESVEALGAFVYGAAHRAALREHFPPPDSDDTEPLYSPEDWTCPA
jgi:hypothetical protein